MGVSVALILSLFAPLCLCVGKSENYLYKSKEWNDDSKAFIFTKQSKPGAASWPLAVYTTSLVSLSLSLSTADSVPGSYLKALLDATDESNVTHFKVRGILSLR